MSNAKKLIQQVVEGKNPRQVINSGHIKESSIRIPDDITLVDLIHHINDVTNFLGEMLDNSEFNDEHVGNDCDHFYQELHKAAAKGNTLISRVQKDIDADDDED